VERLDPATFIGIDIPIGLPQAGLRACDVQAQRLLGYPRMFSVFPAPLRATLKARDYREACAIRYAIEGKKMSKQTFHIIDKIVELDAVLVQDAVLCKRLTEVHPEVSFALWNDGQALKHSKKTREGRLQRRLLIEARWPTTLESLRDSLRGKSYRVDDLYDAFAALWTARRWAADLATTLGTDGAIDGMRLPMRIVA
jgi:predicted RNase H-like nuclease